MSKEHEQIVKEHNEQAVADAKRIVEQMKAEGLNVGRLSKEEFLSEFAHRNAIADLRRQCALFGEVFSARSLKEAVMDDGTVVLAVECDGTTLLSAYKVDGDALTFTVPMGAQQQFEALERPQWLN